MASSYGSVPIANISTGVKAKLQKWMGKASTNVRDKRFASCQEIAAEMTDYELQLQINNAMPVTYHSRTRSAPIPMNYGEKVAKKPRKSSISTPPSSFTKNQGTRENGRINAYPKNGIPRGISHSMVLHESSSEPSSSLQKQNNLNCYSKESNLEDQTDSVAVNATRPAKKMDSNASATSSRATMKGNRPSYGVVSKTSGEYSDESASSDNEKIASNLVFESNPNDVQQLSGKIQTRLQKWVARASHQAALHDRRLSEESASSTDDSLNSPESPKSRSSGSEPKSWTNESQVKKIKELELALKELVENVGVRGGKQGGTRSPGSSTGQRSRNNSQKEHEELDENGNQSLLNKLSRDGSECGLHQGRNCSSSTESDASVNMADGDAKLMIDNSEKSNELCLENQIEDLDDVIFLKSSCPIRDQSKKYVHPHKNGRRSVTLQEVLLCETLIEQCPIQNNKDDRAKKITQTNSKKIHDDITKHKGKGETSLEATITKNRSGKSKLAERQNDTDITITKLSENRPRDGAGRKLERSMLRKRMTAPDSSSLKVVPDLCVRESMRQYLKFKDADLSAFAVECVRHANKKKQISREGDVEKENLGERTVQPSKKANPNETDGAQSVQIAELKPIVIISPQDEDDKTDESERSKTPTDSCGSLVDDDSETANKPVENERGSRYSFARTAEEAEWFAKEFIDPTQENRVAKKESLERSSSNPQRDPVSSQRLYKFPSMPMFYIPNENVDSEGNGKQKKKETVNAPSAPLSPQRRSAASFPSALESLNTRADPFYHGLSEAASTTKQRANSSYVLSGKETSRDENDNEVNKASKKPKLRKRKMSAPSRSGLYPMTNVRVDIEALI